jgi:hypothetical protein
MDMAMTYLKRNRLKEDVNSWRRYEMRNWNDSENVIDHTNDILNVELWDIKTEVVSWLGD